MQLQSDRSHRLDEIKTQFRTREGYYKLLNSPDYSQRSSGITNSNSSIANNEKTSIKISLVTLDDNSDVQSSLRQSTNVCFNIGRELFVYNYDGVRTRPDASNPIYKRSYKGSSPTCHDFNQLTASTESISLLVGLSHGQVQIIELVGCDDQESCKEFNTDKLIDKTRVTCVKWLPKSPSLFLVAHASGQLYLYKDDLTCGPAAPTYQLYKQSEGVTVYTCKTKTVRNPIYKWDITMRSGDQCHTDTTDDESYSLNEFAFSPCAKYLACVSQDGFLRVYCYDTMELVGRSRSYYGGLTCVCWSPDGKYVVTGGEDDLITVWSFVERRVVARGMGHKSWVSVVSFDSYFAGCTMGSAATKSYRFGSVGQDTQLCLWDLNDDLLCQPIIKPRVSSMSSATSQNNLVVTPSQSHTLDRDPANHTINIPSKEGLKSETHKVVANSDGARNFTSDSKNRTQSSGFFSNKASGFTKSFSLVGKRDKRNIGQRSSDGQSNSKASLNPPKNDASRLVHDPTKLLGSSLCPRMNEVPLIEPSVCKKISLERLTSLIFCKDGFMTSCQDGYLFSWARPSSESTDD